MLIEEFIQRIQSLYSKGVHSDDSRLTARQIYSKMKTVRTMLLSQKSRKHQRMSQWNYQTIPCMELIKAMPYECPCLPALGCTIMRSKYKLPSPLMNLDRHLIQSVTSLDGNTQYSPTTWTAKKYEKGNRYTAKNSDYYIHDGYLYITQRTSAKVIAVTGLFEDPVEVDNYPSYCKCEGEDCDDCESPLKREFPIDGELMEPLVEISVNELIAQFSQMQEDQTNDSMDSNREQSK